MSRTPVHICVCEEHYRAGALLARLAAARSDWAVLELKSCPCCTGRAELQVRLARLLREQRPARVLVGYVQSAHLAALERTLASWPLSQYLVQSRTLHVPDDAGLGPEELEAR